MANTTATQVGEMVAAINQQYPAFGPLIAIPDIAKLLIEASVPGQQWSSTKFQAEIQGTDWWRNTSQPARNWQVLQLVQPGEAARASAQTAIQIHQLAATEGIILSPQQLSLLTEAAQSNNWNQAQIQQNIGAQANMAHLTAGTIQKQANDLGKIAQDYGMPLSPHTAFAWSQKIAEGTASRDGFLSYAQDQAKQLFPLLAKHIDQGMTIRQLADPYLQIAGTVLGKDPNAMQVTDPRWSAALQGKDAQGNPTGMMSQQAWTQKLMNDPLYGYDHTVNARDAATNVVQQLATTMGVLK